MYCNLFQLLLKTHLKAYPIMNCSLQLHTLSKIRLSHLQSAYIQRKPFVCEIYPRYISETTLVLNKSNEIIPSANPLFHP